MARLPLEFTFIDNNGKEARTGLYLPEPTTIAELESTVAAYAAVLSAISSAGLLSARWQFFAPDSVRTAPEIGSNSYERALLIFRNATDYGVVSIPSPRGVLFDVAGPYRDIRISRSQLLLLGVLAPLESALAGSVLPDGTAFPSTYSVGGRTGLVP